MRIKMNESMPVTVDGVNTLDLEKGAEVTVGDGVGSDLVASGHADSLDPEAPESNPEPELEQKDAGDADENKDAADEPAEKKKSSRSRKAAK